ncbi:hypothetical protein Leryth_011887 [Lithospermum erythrorhizon]|nr:hypothetical protein Leryth_011887 [Lithospermum erythrorhizon]
MVLMGHRSSLRPMVNHVAGEAIRGWVPRKAESFEKLDKIGQGTYSSVYRARDLETGKVVALKKVRFVNMDPESVRFMAREILILRRLDHPNVMKLEALVTSRVSGNFYLVFEYMQHDLAGLAASPAVRFTESQIKCYMQQLLRGLEHCHNCGVLHRDIKGSNLLIDDSGNLKIGDFGLSTFYRANQKQPLTSRVVTLWYRPPELLLGSTYYGVAVDLWSSGCILAELFAGKPIMPGRTEVEQLHKIFKLCGSPSEEYWKKSKLPHATIFKPQQPYKRCVAETFKDFPASALPLLDSLLAFEPELRGSATSALQSVFFSTEPLPCDLSSFPKYPPSKEYDAKMRVEERRQRAAGGNNRAKPVKESRAVPAPNANAELPVSIQRWRERVGSNTRSNSEQYNPAEEGGSGFRMEQSREDVHNNLHQLPGGEPSVAFHTDSTRHRAELRPQRSYISNGAAARLSRFSNSVASNGSSQFDLSLESNSNKQLLEAHMTANSNQINDGEPSNHALGRSDLSSKNEPIRANESKFGFAPEGPRIHYSGPLLPPPGVNMDEILEQHEKHVQYAVRKARVDKNKTKKDHADNGLKESLLGYDGGVR